ncbi:MULTISPECIES: type II toxin-antitoxin system RelE/ParE family toxin [unclassified Halomonas]|uniref:type II toxin-antitoxin system RelE/ParE family toxin n=1 Tax=unclassified Halomonas TaxID=2609666 RepID=UPI002469801F|nr:MULTISPECIES: type II toxin-antitoxin system RelE/ParE family toxin [unclassified Halomonas]
MSLRHCRHFLIDQLEWNPAEAHAYTRKLVATAAQRLSERPDTYPVCRLALELGIRHYRELLIDGYRVIYRVWPEQGEVSVYLFAHQRQDFKQLLFEYQLLA